MADPITLLDAHAKKLYDADRAKRGFVSAFGEPLRMWSKLTNNAREVWRGKALLDLRSEQTVLDELRSEGKPLIVALPDHSKETK